MASGRQRLTFEDFYGDLENSDNDDSHNGETPNQDTRSENSRDNETVEPDLTSGVSNAFGNLLNTFWRLTGLASKPPVLPDPRTPQRNHDVEVLPDLTTPQRNHHVEVLPEPRTPQRNHHVEVLPEPRTPQRNHYVEVLPDPKTPQRNHHVEVLPDPRTSQRNHHVEVLPDPRTPQRNHHVEVLPDPRTSQRNHHVEVLPDPRTPQRNHHVEVLPDPKTPQRNHHVEVLPEPRTPQRNHHVEVLPDPKTPQRNHHVEVLPDPRTPQRNHYVEVFGGPRSRVYRREKYLAERMTVESCPDGNKVKRCEKDVMSLPTTICKWCGKISSSPLKRCSRCLAVSYCDQQCQKIDLKNHKITCCKARHPAKLRVVHKTCYWGHLDRYDVARARVHPAVKFFPALRHARDYTLLVEDMPSEIQYENGASCNILVEILGRIRNDFRFSFLVMDLEGKVTRVMVHDDKNVYNHPSTDSMRTGCCLPTWLKPGNFMLVVGTYCRIFKDRLPGIRINDLDSVYFINMEDQEAPKKYKEYMEQFVLMENARLERLLGRAVV